MVPKVRTWQVSARIGNSRRVVERVHVDAPTKVLARLNVAHDHPSMMRPDYNVTISPARWKAYHAPDSLLRFYGFRSESVHIESNGKEARARHLASGIVGNGQGAFPGHMGIGPALSHLGNQLRDKGIKRNA